jgi:hypothetical protein
MLGIVFRARLLDPGLGVGGLCRNHRPFLSQPVSGRRTLEADVTDSEIPHAYEALLVQGVDVQLLRPVRPVTDLLKGNTCFRQPAPDVSEDILGGPSFGVVALLKRLLLGKAVEDGVKLVPEPFLFSQQLAFVGGGHLHPVLLVGNVLVAISSGRISVTTTAAP